MSKYPCDLIDRAYDKAVEKEPGYAPGKPERRGSFNRYRLMVSWMCTGCGQVDRCECPED